MEGVSFLLILFITMPAKYLMGIPEPNQIIGMAHGVLFILYIIIVFKVSREFSWKHSRTFLALLASIVPFGTFWADVELFR
jgi:integral membrane protein